MKPVEIVGNKYGRLTVIERDGAKNSDGSYRWICQCDCGVIKSFSKANLDGKNRRSTKSCGCLSEEYSAAITTHAMTGTPEYNAWLNMLNRCNNPSNTHYESYGGRGVSVCPEWASFEAFLKDVGPRPSSLHSLGRIDNNGNYSASNVEWQTTAQQSRNTSRTVLLTINEHVFCMKDWASITGLSYDTLKAKETEADRIYFIIKHIDSSELDGLVKKFKDKS
jgi:hypothetical protein